MVNKLSCAANNCKQSRLAGLLLKANAGLTDDQECRMLLISPDPEEKETMLLQPWQLLLLVLAGWINRQQQDVIAYLFDL